jgi:TetR/AcrR family transcriptional regulator, copper-responsive repressor
MQAFWRLGYSGTSLEELSTATDMNRPSMYAAFGDKRALYLKTLDSYIETAHREAARIFASGATFAQELTEFLKLALSWYLPEGAPARGCYLIATAATECMLDAEVKQRLQRALEQFDQLIAQRVRQARAAGELPGTADAEALASMVMAVNHTLAFRSRAGVPRAVLDTIITGAVQVICGAAAVPANARTR